MNSEKLSKGIVELAEVMARLRGPGGCPWDAEQDDGKISIYVLEEAYEVLEAVERRSSDDVCQELGDLLFQIVFLAQLAHERNEFDLGDVIERIHRKMVYRHPHVFGDAKVRDAEEVAVNWARLKKAEKGHANGRQSPFASIPKNLPALARAHRLLERVGGSDPGGESPEDTGARIRDALEAVLDPSGSQERAEMGRRLGQLLFDLAGLARDRGFNAENLLRGAIRDFTARFEPGAEGMTESLGAKHEDPAPEAP